MAIPGNFFAEKREWSTLIRKHGIAHTTADYKNAVKKREGAMFTVTRDPATTPTGRKSTLMDHNKLRITVAAMPHTPTLLNRQTTVHIL